MGHDYPNKAEIETDITADAHLDDFPPWRLTDPFLMAGVCIGTAFLIGYFIGFFMFQAHMRSGTEFFRSGFGAMLRFAVIGTAALQELSMLIWTAHVVRGKHGLSLSDIGWNIDVSVRWILVAGVAGIVLEVLQLFAASSLQSKPPTVQYSVRSGPYWYDLPLNVATIGIMVPVVEELFFRGFTYTVFRRHFGVSTGIFFSTLFFSACHFQVYQAPITSLLLIVPLGVITCRLYEDTGSLWPPIMVHSMVNITSISYSYFG